MTLHSSSICTIKPLRLLSLKLTSAGALPNQAEKIARCIAQEIDTAEILLARTFNLRVLLNHLECP
ncbi:hypothetical protein D3C76_360500 [compost metagenome]